MPHEDRPDAIERALAALDHRLASIPEAAMRRALVREWAHTHAGRALYMLMRHVVGRPPAHGTAFDPLLEALHQLLQHDDAGSGLAPSLRLEVYARASEAGDAVLLRLLRPPVAARQGDAAEHPLPRELADIPLGRRRSLAKGFDRRMLERLAQDPDPTVIRNLLRNPRIREADVGRLASARPISATTLHTIGADERWSSHASVRAALARNPYSPVPLALQMLNGLPQAELREIGGDATLHADVRAHARAVAERRSSGSGSARPLQNGG